ncbi:MAG: phosphoribosyltransferase [Anaerolineae bacterium]|nr:phosphoribosyltransferase [Anaerolineae bacterium]
MFANRRDAGRRLANELLSHPLIRQRSPADLHVLSIPRGGVIVGQALADVLHCAHDVIIVKKIGCPGQEEFAVGAIAEDGRIALNAHVVRALRLTMDNLMPQIEQVRARVADYVQRFRHGAPLNVTGKLVILTDDGIATGETVKAALTWLHGHSSDAAPAATIVAVPVCPPDTARELVELCDAFVCLMMPRRFGAVGQFYDEFEQVDDAQVWHILNSAPDEAADWLS